MKNYDNSQFNRGRCMYQSKRNPVFTEYEDETYPVNQSLEKSQTIKTVPEAETPIEKIGSKKIALK